VIRYDPLAGPEPAAWQAADEAERLEAVMEFHYWEGVHLPAELLHATFHVVVENQVLMGEELPVEATLRRLMEEGLDRHDAIHAIGSVLAVHVQELLATPHGGPQEDVMVRYSDALGRLTAASWRAQGDQ
jgi:hypothetical protein